MRSFSDLHPHILNLDFFLILYPISGKRITKSWGIFENEKLYEVDLLLKLGSINAAAVLI